MMSLYHTAEDALNQRLQTLLKTSIQVRGRQNDSGLYGRKISICQDITQEGEAHRNPGLCLGEAGFCFLYAIITWFCNLR